MTRIRALCGFALAWLAATSLAAQIWRGPAGIAVEVNDDHGRPVAGAELLLLYTDVDPPVGPPPLASGADGTIEARGLAEGNWSLEVRRSGYFSYLATVELRRGKKPGVGFESVLKKEGSAALLSVRVRKAAGEPSSFPGSSARRPSLERRHVPPPATVEEPRRTPPPGPTMPARPESPPAAPEAGAAPPPNAPTGARPAVEPAPATTPASAVPPPVAPAKPAPRPVAPPAGATPGAHPSPEVPPVEPPIATTPAPAAPPPVAPVEPAPRPVAPPAGATPSPGGPPAAEPRVFTRVGSARDGSCAECRAGEWSVTVEQAAGPVTDGRGADCRGEAESAMDGFWSQLGAAADLAGSFGALLGPGADRPGGGTAANGRLAALTDPASPCQLLAAVLPAGARYVGFQYEVGDDQGGGSCFPGRDCPVGDAVWPEAPIIRRVGGAVVVYAPFENRSPAKVRRVRLTVYFTPPSGTWAPPR